MAYTVAKEHTVFGNKKVALLTVTADGAESNIDTGLSVITGYAIGTASMTSYPYSLKINVNSSGTASLGKIGASGITSGDTFFLIVYGR